MRDSSGNAQFWWQWAVPMAICGCNGTAQFQWRWVILMAMHNFKRRFAAENGFRPGLSRILKTKPWTYLMNISPRELFKPIFFSLFFSCRTQVESVRPYVSLYICMYVHASPWGLSQTLEDRPLGTDRQIDGQTHIQSLRPPLEPEPCFPQKLHLANHSAGQGYRNPSLAFGRLVSKYDGKDGAP